MASKALPLLLLGGAALVLMSRKKGTSTPALPEMVAPPTKGKSGTSTWKKRQQALVDTGFDVGPSGVDGKPGPATRAAIRAFQAATGIDVDGKWGAQTAAAMAIAIENALRGLGEASYGQIGSMLDKFKSSLFDVFGNKEEDTGTKSDASPPQYVGSGWTGWSRKDLFPTEGSFLPALGHLGYEPGGSILDDNTRSSVTDFQVDFNEVLAWWQANTPAFKGYSPLDFSGLIDAATVDALWQAQSMQDTTQKKPWPQIVAESQG